MGLKAAVKQLWIRKIEKKYIKLLAEKKVGYDVWVKQQETGMKFHEKTAAEQATQVEYVLLLQKNGTLSSHAHAWIEKYFRDNPEVQVLYGDEDFISQDGRRKDPWYKPCWSPDTYLSQFYVGSAVAVRKEAAAALGELTEEEQFTGRVMFENPQEIRSRLTRTLKICGAFEKGSSAVAGCPHILFHVKDESVWNGYLESAESTVRTYGEMNDISVIIPSKDNPLVLGKCIEALKNIPGLEMLIVDNGSSAENRDKVRRLVEAVNIDIQRRQSARYLYQPMEFNFSKMCNIGAKAAFGKYLLFLNDDIETCGTEWIYAMRQKAAKSYVGAVGLKLYYPDGIRIQHAGITNLPVGPVHKMQFAEDERSIYFGRNRADMNCLAVTGACLMIEKGKYAEVGGLKETLRVAYNDVELGFALYEAGYWNVVLNSYYAYHHESLSRGNDETKEKMQRLISEREKLYQMHPALRNEDPFYPEGLSKDGLDSRIVPAYVGSHNTIQQAKITEMFLDMKQIREDKCLFLGMELSERRSIRGYGVVLGDNNACYDRYLVLAEEGKENALTVKVQPQYRQDLEENMADQKNVAMSGFYIHFGNAAEKKLSKGCQYRVGVMAVNKINKGKLLNWSGRYFTI